MAYNSPHPIAPGNLGHSEYRFVEAPTSLYEQWISTPSCTVVSGQATPSPSMSISRAKSVDGAQRRLGRGGRPATARRIWSNPAMQRTLVRLYLYNAEDSLSTKQMSKLITDLARHRGARARSVLRIPSWFFSRCVSLTFNYNLCAGQKRHNHRDLPSDLKPARPNTN